MYTETSARCVLELCVFYSHGQAHTVNHPPSVFNLPSIIMTTSVCVCVWLCFSPQFQINGGSRQAGRQPFTLSSVLLCNLGEKKRAREEKEGERKGAHVLVQILQVPFFIFLFNILQRKYLYFSFLCVCSLGLVQDSWFCFTPISFRLYFET